MIKISIFYPNHKDSRFDMDYYLNSHMPLAINLFSTHPGFRGVSVERGLGGRGPDTAPTYIVMCHFLFTSIEDYMAAFGAHSPALRGDMPNYTDIESILQVSEVLISQ
jgi:uncharacterized protein (TIGR02118 family)